MQGVAGELRRTAADDIVAIGKSNGLDLKRAPLRCSPRRVPCCRRTARSPVTVEDMRHADLSLGAFPCDARTAREQVWSSRWNRCRARRTSSPRRAGALSVTRVAALEFTADTDHLAALLRGVQLPAEWPTETLHAAGELSWPADLAGRTDAARSTGRFDLETQGRDSSHQLLANATLADGQITLAERAGHRDPRPTRCSAAAAAWRCWRVNTT